jgi:5'-3' exonuclease
MGIKGLFSNIKKYAAESIRQRPLSAYKDKRIAIDAEILIYKYKHNKYSKKTNITSEEMQYSYLYPLINTAASLLKNGIHPIYVFDGVPHQAKQANCISLRKVQRDINLQKLARYEKEYEELMNTELTNSDYEARKAREAELVRMINVCRNKIVTRDYRNEFKTVLKWMGLPVIFADDDAERMCVDLVRRGFADYVYTEDSDAIVYAIAGSLNNSNYNCKSINILKSFTKYGSSWTFTEIDTEQVLCEFMNKLAFTTEKFIDFCINSGCDFLSTNSKIVRSPAIENEIRNETEDSESNLLVDEVRKIFHDTSSYYETMTNEQIEFELSMQTLDKTSLFDFVSKTKINNDFLKDYVKTHNNFYNNNLKFRE